MMSLFRRLSETLAAIRQNGAQRDQMITYGLGLLGLLVVGYGVYHDMIGWTLPTYAAY